MTQEVHVLEPVKSLWEVWSHEAHRFTPWLVDHLDRLGDALSMELKFEARARCNTESRTSKTKLIRWMVGTVIATATLTAHSR